MSARSKTVENEQVRQTIVSTLVVSFIGFLSLSAFYFFFGKEILKPSKPSEAVVNPKVEIEVIKGEKERNRVIPKELSEFNSFEKVSIYPEGLITPLGLITACEDKKKDSYKCNKELAKITRVLKTEGQIQKAYLYMKVGVSRGGSPIGLLTGFDSVWLFVDSVYNSGHLLRSKAILNRQTKEGLTELLFNLHSIPFTHLPYDDNRKLDKEPDVLGSLKEKGEHLIASFVSTLGYGKLEELTIGYDGGHIELVD